MILVTGATGEIGREVARLLGEAHVPFRAMYRSEGDRERLAQSGAEPVQGSFDDLDSLQSAMQGCDQLFLLPPPTPDQEWFERNALSAANQTTVGKIVKVSAADASLTSPVPWAKAHAIAEQELRSSGIHTTILRPSAFMQNFLQMAKPIRKGFLPLPAGRGSVAWVHAHDVAAVASRILMDGGHDQRTYFLTGSRQLSLKQVAESFSNVLGRKVRYLDLPRWAYRASLRAAGLSPWLAKGLTIQFGGLVAKGYDIAATQEVEALTGHPPRTLESFIEENSAALSAVGGKGAARH